MVDGVVGGYWTDTREIIVHRVYIMMSEAKLKCHRSRIRVRY